MGRSLAFDRPEYGRSLWPRRSPSAHHPCGTALTDDEAIDIELRHEHQGSCRRSAELLAGLPGGMCQCRHWGFMTAGRMTVRYVDREEVFDAGDAFYMPPGHTPAAEAGTEFIQFSSTDLLAETEGSDRTRMQDTAN